MREQHEINEIEDDKERDKAQRARNKEVTEIFNGMTEEELDYYRRVGGMWGGL